MSEHDRGLYGDRAAYYDAIYHAKPYAKEAERLHAILVGLGVREGARVLEAACGTGRYLAELARWYRVAGFDLARPMLAIARRRAPAVPVFQADMASFAVRQPFDALLCLFSSIGYVFPLERLRAAARAFAAAVRPGGALVIEPWIDPDAYKAGSIFAHHYQDDGLLLTRASRSGRQGDLALVDFHWQALRRDPPALERFDERHALWLCPRDLMLSAFRDAGFAVASEPDGLMPARGLIVGRREGP